MSAEERNEMTVGKRRKEGRSEMNTWKRVQGSDYREQKESRDLTPC